MRFIAIILLSFAVSTAANENMVQNALEFAKYHSGLADPVEPRPEIKFVDNLCKQICGFYVFKEHVIKIDSRALYDDQIRLEALLIHEFVHYLQRANGLFAGAEGLENPDCAVVYRNELQAYEIQSQFLLHHGIMNFHEVMTFKRNFTEERFCKR